LPFGHTAFLYPYDGDVLVGPTEAASLVKQGQLGTLSEGDTLELKATGQGARLLFAAAKPLHEPVAKYGPFVMTTDAEIEQAVADFRAGRF
jgi:redox-sensitive bicupin YhaK (pirin superfamily)